MNRKDFMSSIVARHTGLNHAEAPVVRIGPSPAIQFPFTPPVRLGNTLLVTKIRFRVIDTIVMSPVPTIPALGIGWSTTVGKPNTLWQTEPTFFDTGVTGAFTAFSKSIGTTFPLALPPVNNDKLVVVLGEWVDNNQINPASISSGRIHVEVSWAVYDEWGDLPEVH